MKEVHVVYPILWKFHRNYHSCCHFQVLIAWDLRNGCYTIATMSERVFNYMKMILRTFQFDPLRMIIIDVALRKI
jgi:hypothetical protein